MKIGLVCPYNMFKGGGVQECVLALQAELTSRGHDAKIITPRPYNHAANVPDSMILVGTAKDVKSPFHTTAQLAVSLDVKELQKMLDEQQFDVLHFHEPWVPMISKQILSRSGAAHVGTFHAKLPDGHTTRTIQKAATPYTSAVLKCLDELVAVSDAAAEYVRSIDKREVAIVPNGINLDKYTFVERESGASDNTILYVGRLEKRKGVRYLLLAFAQLQKTNPDAKLIIGGDGVDRTRLETFVKNKRIKNVTFEGFLSEQRKLDLLAQADVFCSPALYGESFGIVLLEAMARGCVVVAGNNPGYRAVLADRGKLSLVDPKNVAEFARRLDIMLSDHELRKLWLQWSKDYVQQFNYTDIVSSYEKVYERAVKKKAERSA